MINYKRLISASILLTVTGLAVAQTSTNSPYTRYGFGQLADQNFGNSKAMGGIAYGLRNGYQINASNPASYTACLLYTSPSPRDRSLSRMPSSA